MFDFKKGYYADVRIEDRFSTYVSYRNGNMEECKENSVKKAFIRVFDGEKWYYASTYKLADINGELDKLYACATKNDNINDDKIVKRFEVNVYDNLRFANDCVKNVDIKEKSKFLTDRLQYLQNDYVKMNVATYIDRYSEYEFYSSKGTSLHYDFQLSGAVFVIALANEKDNFTNYTQKCCDTFSKVTFSERELKDFVDEGVHFLNNAKSVTAGAYPVIFAPEVAGVFAHESFGHKSEADFMIGDETMRKEWAIGKKVGSDILSIYDSGLEEGSGYVLFDDEGTRTKKTYLIKNGVLTGRLHNVITAADMDEELTGNARAINTDYEPIVRMTSTIIDAGKDTFDDLVKGIKHGYFIKTVKHGSGMSTFTIAPNIAYEIVDGKIGEPVKIAVITGNVFETLGLIDGLSNEKIVCSSISGGCGKMEQFPLPVSDGGPYVRISKMNIQ